MADASTFPLLSALIWFPVIGGLLVLWVGNRFGHLTRGLAMAVAVATLLLSLPLALQFDTSTAAMQFEEKWLWIERFGVYYHLGVDGISMPFIVLTSFITVIVVWAAWEVIQDRFAGYLAAFLIMTGLMNGVFAALDAVLFYIFWEAELIPVFLMMSGLVNVGCAALDAGLFYTFS